jgi:hypothetical protein
MRNDSSEKRNHRIAILATGALLVSVSAFAFDVNWGSFAPWPGSVTYDEDYADEWVAASNAPRALGFFAFLFGEVPRATDYYQVVYPDGPRPIFRVFIPECSYFSSLACGNVQPNW